MKAWVERSERGRRGAPVGFGASERGRFVASAVGFVASAVGFVVGAVAVPPLLSPTIHAHAINHSSPSLDDACDPRVTRWRRRERGARQRG